MKRIITFALLLAVLFSSLVTVSTAKNCDAKDYVTYYVPSKQTVVDNYIQTNSDGTQNNFSSNYTVKYNDLGLTIKSISNNTYGSNSSSSYSQAYSYNKHGWLTSRTSSNDENDSNRKDKYTYTSDGRLLKIESTTNNSSISESNFKYDSSKRLVSKEGLYTDSGFSYIKGSEWKSVSHSKNTYSYDSSGNLIEDYYMSWADGRTPDEGIKDIKKYSFDGSNNCLKTTLDSGETYIWSYTSINSKGEVKDYFYQDYEIKDYVDGKTITYTSSTTTYDKNGRLIKEQKKNKAGKIVENKKYTYDSKGNQIEETFLNADGKVLKKIKNAYDKKGLLVTITTLDSNGKTLSTAKYNRQYKKIANKERLVKTVVKDKSGRVLSTIVNSYNKEGKETKTVVKNAKGIVTSSTIYSYNKKKGTRSIIDKDSSGKTTYSNTEYYNSKGKLTKRVIKSGKDKYTYSFDSYGNIIKAITKNSNAVTTKIYKRRSKPICYIDGMYLSNWRYVYDGAEKRPSIGIDMEVPNVDYIVRYFDNIKPGKAKIKVYSLSSQRQSIITFDIEPSKVSNLKITDTTKSSVKLKWDKVPEASFYQIMKSLDGKKWTVVKTLSKNSYTVSSLKSGKKYQFKVCALDSLKQVKGAYSAVKNVTVKK